MNLKNIPALEKYKIISEITVHEDKSIYQVEDTVEDTAEDTSGNLYILKVFQNTYRYALYESLSKLVHENMPRIHEVSLCEDCFYIVEDCITGRTLRESLEASGALGKKETINILMQLCDILMYLHSQPVPIIHRDITPANIMITDDGIVKLIDFDIAREYKNEVSSDTEVLGTKPFAPPEQYGFSQSDPRTDIYSLGMLITVMLTNTYDVQKIKDLQLKRAVERCMKLSPEKRFQNAKKLKDRLERIKGKKHGALAKIIAAAAVAVVIAITPFVVREYNYRTYVDEELYEFLLRFDLDYVREILGVDFEISEYQEYRNTGIGLIGTWRFLELESPVNLDDFEHNANSSWTWEAPSPGDVILLHVYNEHNTTKSGYLYITLSEPIGTEGYYAQASSMGFNVRRVNHVR